MTPAGVELHIDELVLYGFDPRDRHRIGDAVERELTRLLAGPGAVDAVGNARDVPAVDAGAVSFPRGAAAGAVGEGVARAVYGGLRQ